MRQYTDDSFIKKTCQLIEILMGLGKKPEAEEIQKRALRYFDHDKIRDAIKDAEQKMKKGDRQETFYGPPRRGLHCFFNKFSNRIHAPFNWKFYYRDCKNKYKQEVYHENETKKNSHSKRFCSLVLVVDWTGKYGCGSTGQ
jgi:hypothetical protein